MKLGYISGADGITSIANVKLTNSTWDRMRGLLGAPELQRDEGLLIKPCNMIHTAFMRYSIDLVFMDRLGSILAVYENIKPWRMAMCFKAKMVLELRSGAVTELKIGSVEQLLWHPKS